MSIQRLPEEVVAQIKSSTAIVSLNGVVVELLKNSLDARASKIDATVDFARGSCTVEDNGLGIAPAEFGEDGGLGKLYCTSKYHSDDPQLGRNGTFLASLSAMSLLTITSHHHAYRSHNSISFHHSQLVERQVPSAAHSYVHNMHGTRVTARNLFGNMPVRVKQRSMVMDQRTEHQRLRDALKRDVAGLLLSWQGAVSLKIRDGDNKTIVNFNTSNAVVGETHSAATGRPRSAHLALLLRVLTQANYIAIDEWDSWVPASASTSTLTIKGAISIEPSPSKFVQFISFGLRPLSSEHGHNELYDHINRLFALSSFGTVEDDVDVDEQEKLRRQLDKRFKTDGYTNRQLKARKGVDRYPKFHLRISPRENRSSSQPDDQFIENEANLQAITDIFSAMVTQWLSVHHFRPKNMRKRPDPPRTASTPTSEAEKEAHTPSEKRRARTSTPTRPSSGASRMKSVTTDTAPTKRPVLVPLDNASPRPHRQAFAEWSRIKSGKSNFFDGTCVSAKETIHGLFDKPTASGPRAINTQPSSFEEQQEHAVFDIAPIPKGALDGTDDLTSTEQENQDQTTIDTISDETVLWTDPSTRKTYLFNARTGCVMPSRHTRPHTDPITSELHPTQKTVRSLRQTAPKPTTAESVRTPWLDGLLHTWENPVFKPSEKGIQQISLQDGLERELQHPQRLNGSHFYMEKVFSNAELSSAKLSKEGLRSAEVISQVDKKFILVRLKDFTAGSEAGSTVGILVLIDQHAADERIQVEMLLAKLCAPVAANSYPGYQSVLGHTSNVNFVNLEKPLQFLISSQEHDHFVAHAASFAAWGILYDIHATAPTSGRASSSMRDGFILSVTTLPPVISERCKTDPQILITFLRSALWRYVESPLASQTISSEREASWVKKISTCPPGLIDMVNSRACRSAIMFNDELSREECIDLVSKLADCTFPFMCAHGRPSMVPIVDLSTVGALIDESGFSRRKIEGSGSSFVQAWKKWKR
ncbi:DNA mismatch repair protein [Neodidymelliopsis sp. IMI 364377]|nr:DNA mismatch repair protein [Neodidymelliopsis sp. IMI 364377]